MRNVFLDHQSSTPLLPEAFEAMRPFFLTQYGNPSSLHRYGLEARDALARARVQLGMLINAESPDNIIFTSGGTEAANLAVKGVAYANEQQGRHVVLTVTEHPSVQNSADFLEQHGFSVTRVPVDRMGLVDPAVIRSVLRNDTVLVCVHHVNHEVGAIQPLREIAEVTNEKGIPLFVDAVASAGWLAIDVQALGLSLLSLAPHRFYGPKGTGILYRNRQVRLAGILQGGDQEGGSRAGTENVPAVVGAGVAAEVACRELNQRQRHTQQLQRVLWDKLRQAVEYVGLNGPELGPRRISTNLNLSAEFTEGEGQLLALDMAGIAVASGAACVSKSIRSSQVLEAMNINPNQARSSIMISLGKDNTLEEIDYTIASFTRVISRLRAMSPLWQEFESGLIDSTIQPGRRASRVAGTGLASAFAPKK